MARTAFLPFIRPHKESLFCDSAVNQRLRSPPPVTQAAQCNHSVALPHTWPPPRCSVGIVVASVKTEREGRLTVNQQSRWSISQQLEAAVASFNLVVIDARAWEENFSSSSLTHWSIFSLTLMTLHLMWPNSKPSWYLCGSKNKISPLCIWHNVKHHHENLQEKYLLYFMMCCCVAARTHSAAVEKKKPTKINTGQRSLSCWIIKFQCEPAECVANEVVKT